MITLTRSYLRKKYMGTFVNAIQLYSNIKHKHETSSKKIQSNWYS